MGVTVAQPLMSSGRLIRPPRINALIALALFRLNDCVPVAGLVFGSILQPPEKDCPKRAKNCDGTGDHSLPLFAGDLRNEINNLLQGALRLIAGDDCGHGNGGRKDGRGDSDILLPVRGDIVDDVHALPIDVKVPACGRQRLQTRWRRPLRLPKQAIALF